MTGPWWYWAILIGCNVVTTICMGLTIHYSRVTTRAAERTLATYRRR